MATQEELEVYRQRYETYRHLDKLRWQMLQISMAVAPLILAFSIRAEKEPPWWSWLVVGLFLLITGWVMDRIRQGINKNSDTLIKFGKAVGDTAQPAPKPFHSSSAFWVSVLLRGFGLVSVVVGTIVLRGN